MDGQRCPVCGGVNFQPCGKVRNSDGEDADGKRCLCCCYVFCDFDLALADKTRSRLIAEVVKLWRELVSETFGIEGDLTGWRGLASDPESFACEFCKAEHRDCNQIPHKPDCLVSRARKLLAQSESVKATSKEETT